MAVLSRTLIWCCSSLERRLLAQRTSCTRSERKSWSWFCLNVHKALIWTALLCSSLLTLPLSVCVTYCTSILLSSGVSAFPAEVLRWSGGLFFIIVSLLLPRPSAARIGCTFLDLQCKRCLQLFCSLKATLHVGCVLSDRLMSLWSRPREAHLSLTSFRISRSSHSSLLLPALCACSHSFEEESLLSSFLLYRSFQPARTLLGAWCVEDIFFEKRVDSSGKRFFFFF